MNAAVVYVNNGAIEYDVIPETVTTADTVTEKNALRIFMKNVSDPENYKRKNVMITDIKREDITYEITAADFMKYGRVVDVNDGETADDFRADE